MRLGQPATPKGSRLQPARRSVQIHLYALAAVNNSRLRLAVIGPSFAITPRCTAGLFEHPFLCFAASIGAAWSGQWIAKARVLPGTWLIYGITSNGCLDSMKVHRFGSHIL
uniref:Uncharacterized protein n=1 Tax=Sphaerodactylus townsendi TaxID=933632 RepID=A0ACB8EM21_9SAUR